MFPGGSEIKASACNVGDLGSISGSGRSPGEGNGNPLQYSCMENSMDRGAWQATVHGIKKSQTQLRDLIIKVYLSFMSFEEENHRKTIFSTHYQGYTVAARCITVDTDLFRSARSVWWKGVRDRMTVAPEVALSFLSENEISSLACCSASFSLF